MVEAALQALLLAVLALEEVLRRLPLLDQAVLVAAAAVEMRVVDRLELLALEVLAVEVVALLVVLPVPLAFGQFLLVGRDSFKFPTLEPNVWATYTK